MYIYTYTHVYIYTYVCTHKYVHMYIIKYIYICSPYQLSSLAQVAFTNPKIAEEFNHLGIPSFQVRRRP